MNSNLIRVGDIYSRNDYKKLLAGDFDVIIKHIDRRDDWTIRNIIAKVVTEDHQSFGAGMELHWNVFDSCFDFKSGKRRLFRIEK